MSISVKIHKKLNNFSLSISFQSQSRRIGILGASGCGKSMTLKSIAGIVTPDEGRIEIEGRTLFDRAARIDLKPQKRNVGYLFQNYALFPTMTVEKNIAAGLKCSRKEKADRVSQMVEKFRLNGLEKRLPGQLSGGQQQRVALARIMAYEPDVILLDEPFSALDMFLKDQLQREMTDLLEDYKGTVILVSHNRDEVYRFSEELFVIDQGRISASGPTEQLFRDPVSREAARLTGCKNFSKIRKTDDHTLEAMDWGISLHIKREIPSYASYIGYRAHDFIPVWGERGSNMIRFSLESSAVLPFENNYYVRPEIGSSGSHTGGGKLDEKIKARESRRGENMSGDESAETTVLCWFVQRDREEELAKRGLPDYLAFDEDKMLFLQ